MSYYDTIDEDLKRAREILERGRGGEGELPPLPPGLTRDGEATERLRSLIGGTIYGLDIYAAYKLIESFVGEIERLQREDAEANALRERLTSILTRTANALHGGPHPNGAWSWHDLPELVERLRDVQIIQVVGPDGEGVAAPCAIDGCQYGQVERLREDRDFWDRKAGEEHARAEKAEAERDALRRAMDDGGGGLGG